MYVASYVTDISLEDIRDTASNATYCEGDDLDLMLVAIARGHVVAVSDDPIKALHAAIIALVNEVADGYNLEPDLIRDCMTTKGVDFDTTTLNLEHATKVVVYIDIPDEEGDSDAEPTRIVAGISIDHFVPVTTY